MPIIITVPISRRRSNLTQKQLANLTKRSQQLIGKLEQNKAKGIGFDTLANLCESVGSAEIESAIAYIPEDVTKWDEVINDLSRRLGCEFGDVFSLLSPEDQARYRKQFRLVS